MRLKVAKIPPADSQVIISLFIYQIIALKDTAICIWINILVIFTSAITFFHFINSIKTGDFPCNICRFHCINKTIYKSITIFNKIIKHYGISFMMLYHKAGLHNEVECIQLGVKINRF